LIDLEKELSDRIQSVGISKDELPGVSQKRTSKKKDKKK
jgi:hypothetical protein